MTDEQQDGVSNGWQEWSNYVLKALEKSDERLTAFDCRLRRVEAEQAVLKAKLALYVAGASAILVVVAEVLRFVIK